jgi:hypothetical protein
MNKSAKREVMENRQADSLVAAIGFDTIQHYTQSVCLQHHGKPLLRLSGKVAELDSTLSFRFDPNGSYNYEYPRLNDYLSVDDEFLMQQQQGSANGIVLFSSDPKGRIFEVRGRWLLDMDTSQQVTQDALRTIARRLFPCLNSHLPLAPGEKIVIRGPQFNEIFELHAPDTTGFQKYSLSYYTQFSQ